ncbi:hypothetical protein DY000_02025189 [Brassica cretica]|uniref:Uncharacterized protein n=1 Tax=Brassica cretica TaxID=69181 RepID=A0ABQ7ECI3_BRACR|nr:hypothetical protein DY000_02025189 [Brassica cretica]
MLVSEGINSIALEIASSVIAEQLKNRMNFTKNRNEKSEICGSKENRVEKNESQELTCSDTMKESQGVPDPSSDVRDPRAAPARDLFLVRDSIRQLVSDDQGVPDQATKDVCDPIEATRSIPARVSFVSSSRLNSFVGPIQQSSKVKRIRMLASAQGVPDPSSDVRDPRAAPARDLFLVRDSIRQLASDDQGVPDQATKDVRDPIEATRSIPARVPFVSSSRLNSFGGPIQQSSKVKR